MIIKMLNRKVLYPCSGLVRIIFIVTLFSLGPIAKADEYAKELTVSLGMSQISFAEVESKVDATAGGVVEAQSGSVSILSMDLRYKILPSDKLDYFFRITAPFLTATGDSYFSGHFGFNYYFKSRGSRVELSDMGSHIKFIPKIKYYAGAEVGLAAFVFSNEVVKRRDTLFNIGGHAGVMYNFSENWAANASIHFAKGTGANTTTTAIQFFAGVTYFIGFK